MLRNHRTPVSQRGRTASGTHIVKLTNAKGTGETQHHRGEASVNPPAANPICLWFPFLANRSARTPSASFPAEEKLPAIETQ